MQNSSFGAFPPGTTEGAFIQFFADADCTSPVNNGFDVKAYSWLGLAFDRFWLSFRLRAAPHTCAV